MNLKYRDVDDIKQSEQIKFKGQNPHLRDEQRKKSLKGDREELPPGKAKGDLVLKMAHRYYFCFPSKSP